MLLLYYAVVHTADTSALPGSHRAPSAPGGVAGEPGGEADFDHLTKAAEEMMATWAAEDDDHPPNTGKLLTLLL